MNFLDPRLPERFWSKVQPCPMSGCWLWTGAIDHKGYARYVVDGSRSAIARVKRGHRIAYAALVGPIRDELDHLCRVRCCINPAHLEDVDHRTNVLRGDARGAVAVRTDLCSRGHDLTLDEPHVKRTPEGFRICRVCARERTKEWNARRRAAMEAT